MNQARKQKEPVFFFSDITPLVMAASLDPTCNPCGPGRFLPLQRRLAHHHSKGILVKKEDMGREKVMLKNERH
jgi:hypothetical protein